MLDRTAERFDIRPDWLAADTAYGSEDNLVEIVLKRQILPFIPVIDKGERTDGTLSRSDFAWDEENDRYICPKGHDLRHRRRNYSNPERFSTEMKPRRYRASKADCQTCSLKEQCCPNGETRSLQRGKFKIMRDFARSCTASAFNGIASKRRKKVEMLFAHLKRILGLNRLRLRGPLGAKDEFTLAAIAQSLRKMAKLCPTTAHIARLRKPSLRLPKHEGTALKRRQSGPQSKIAIEFFNSIGQKMTMAARAMADRKPRDISHIGLRRAANP